MRCALPQNSARRHAPRNSARTLNSFARSLARSRSTMKEGRNPAGFTKRTIRNGFVRSDRDTERREGAIFREALRNN
jgi:hypothetical protein